jgi:hypothetical protein
MSRNKIPPENGKEVKTKQFLFFHSDGKTPPRVKLAFLGGFYEF